MLGGPPIVGGPENLGAAPGAGIILFIEGGPMLGGPRPLKVGLAMVGGPRPGGPGNDGLCIIGGILPRGSPLEGGPEC